MSDESDPRTPTGTNARIRVETSADKMSATVIAYLPPKDGGKGLDEDGIVDALEDAGVKIQAKGEAVQELFALIDEGESPVGLVLAKGKPPVHGKDGVVRFKVRTALSVGRQEEHDRIDYHDRGIVQSVVAGQFLVSVSPPTGGRPGEDVTGAVVPAHKGSPAVFRAGENVEVSEDGSSFYAAVDGMVKYVHSVLSVSETFEISGDVDLHTGNIDMKRGSVIVRGVVRGGFKVFAAGNIVVREEIEDAIIRSGGDLEVRNGILGATVKSDGAVFAKFARNSRIEACGDVKIANNLHNCDLVVGGAVIMTSSKGVIRGGSIRCGGGVEAGEIGSRTDAATRIAIDTMYEDETSLLEEKADLEESVKRINLFLGGTDVPPSPVVSPEEEEWFEDGETKKPDRIKEALKSLYAELTQVNSKLSAIRRQKRQQAGSVVAVHGLIHPGTVIEVSGRSFVVKERMERCRFYYDSETDTVESSPL